MLRQGFSGIRAYSHQASLQASRLRAVEAVESVDRAFAEWRTSTLTDRVGVFLAAADALQARRSDIIDACIREVSMPPPIAAALADDGVRFVRESAHLLASPAPTSYRLLESTNVLVTRDPIGPVFGIAPWNVPTMLTLRAIMAPLSAGCTTVIKTSSIAPDSQAIVASAFADVGAPKGTVEVVSVSDEHAPVVVEDIISHPAIRKINFTGSTTVGRDIAIAAAKNLKPVLLELGGKCAAVVDSSADLPKAAETIITGAWLLAGQICMSTERVYVIKDVAEEFTSLLKETALRMLSERGSTLRMVNDVRASKADALIKDALDKGAQLIAGSGSVTGADFGPCILGNVTPDMQLHDTESFAPVVYVNVVDDIDEAIEHANGSSYGLNCSVWTQDVGRGLSIAARLESGSVHINGNTIFDRAAAPHGGAKGSGYGRFNSQWGYNEFSLTKTVTFPSSS